MRRSITPQVYRRSSSEGCRVQGVHPVIEVALYGSVMMVNWSEQFRFRSTDSEGKQPLAAQDAVSAANLRGYKRSVGLGNFTERFDSLIYAFVQVDHVKQLR